MKRTTLLLILTLLLCSASLVQQPTAPPKENKTKLEAFQAKTGTVLIKGVSTVGIARSPYGATVTIESKEFTDAATNRTEHGISFEVKESGRLERENTSYVDYDEIDSLIKGIDYIGKMTGSVTKLKEFQADYRTKGDLMFSTFSLGRSRDRGSAR